MKEKEKKAKYLMHRQQLPREGFSGNTSPGSTRNGQRKGLVISRLAIIELVMDREIPLLTRKSGRHYSHLRRLVRLRQGLRSLHRTLKFLLSVVHGKADDGIRVQIVRVCLRVR